MLRQTHNKKMSNKDDLKPSLDRYWPISHNLAMIDGVAMMDKQLFVPFTLQKQTLDKLHSNHIGIERCGSSQESQYTGST